MAENGYIHLTLCIPLIFLPTVQFHKPTALSSTYQEHTHINSINICMKSFKILALKLQSISILIAFMNFKDLKLQIECMHARMNE